MDRPDSENTCIAEKAASSCPPNLFQEAFAPEDQLAARRGKPTDKAEKTPPQDKAAQRGVLDRIPPSPDLQKSIDAFAAQHHLEIKNTNGSLNYTMNVYGQTHVLFRTDASEYGLRDATTRLYSLTNSKQKALEATYGVSFAASGTPIDYQRDSATSPASRRVIYSGSPELFQLIGIESALAKSAPTSLADARGNGLKLYFLPEKVQLDKTGDASYQIDRSGNPSIYFFPSFDSITKATEQDLTPAEARLSFADPKRPNSVEAALIHELGHYQFAKFGFNRTAEGEILQSNMGWVRNQDFNNPKVEWLLLGKAADKDGSNSSYLADKPGPNATWSRTKPDGSAIDSTGRRVPPAQAEKLDATQLRTRALVKPPTSNFDNPEEEYAETVKMLRLGARSRRELIRESPLLYDMVKANDQREIDHKYGNETDGTPKVVRAPSGELVPNSVAARTEIDTFEILSMYPDLKPGVKPGLKPDVKPDLNPSLKPGQKQGLTPDLKPKK